MKFVKKNIENYKCHYFNRIKDGKVEKLIHAYCEGVAHMNDMRYCTCTDESAIEKLKQDEST